MGPLAMFWLASAVGAGLFFVGGFLTRGLRGGATQDELTHAQEAQRVLGHQLASTTTLANAAASEVEAMRGQLGAVRQQAQAAQQQAQAVQQQYAHAQQEAQQGTEQLEALQRKSADADRLRAQLKQLEPLQRRALEADCLRAQLEPLKQRVLEADRVRAQLEPLKQRALEADRLRAQVKQLEPLKQRALEAGRLQTQLKQLMPLQQRALEADRLQARVGQLEAAQTQAAQTQAAQTQAVRADNREHDVAVAKLKQEHERRCSELSLDTTRSLARIKQLESYADENVHLRAKARQVDQAQARIQALEQQLQKLASPGPALPPVRPPIASAQVEPEPETTGPGCAEPTVQGGLEQQLRQALLGAGHDSAVLADEQGLLIAGAGADRHQQTMAALGSLAEDLARRTDEYLPMGMVRSLELSSDDSVVRFRLFDWDDNQVILTTFGRRARCEDREEEKVVSVFPALMTAAS